MAAINFVFLCDFRPLDAFFYMQMLHQCCRALKMLSFGIWHKPICTTQVTEKTKMAATLTVSIRVFMDFRPLDCIFLYANVTPIL